MKKLLPYVLITIFFVFYVWFFHRGTLTYKIPSNLVHDYLRSQDIEDPKGLIKDRITVSDSDIYISTGYLYATGTDPTIYNFQHPPLVKYLFGFSTLLTGNPFWVQIIFGLTLLYLTYFLGIKLGLGNIGYLGVLGVLIDPVFGGMMDQALLDLGQSVFSMVYLIILFFFPESFILEGIFLGLSAASKFWSTTIILVILTMGYRLFLRKEKLNYKKLGITFLIAFLVFGLTYTVSFINGFNIFSFEGKVFKFMLTHNSANIIGGPILLFVTGYFAPWWTVGIERAKDWFFLWPLGLVVGMIGAFREFRKKTKNYILFVYLFPIVYLLLTSTQVPFTRYFILILPFIYLGLASFLFGLYRQK